MTAIHTFLGANSPKGFVSLYDGFTDSSCETLYIIKGFPGSGKSTFMKRIASMLSGAGADIEYVHCSGDPDSLDGIYFPQLGIAYADGTAPHVIEPRIAGASESYVNLSAFCRADDMASLRDEIASLSHDYKSEYAKAYASLSAAAAIEKAYASPLSDVSVSALKRRASSAAARRLPPKSSGEGTVQRRFLSALTCKGEIAFADTVSALADSILLLEKGPVSEIFLSGICTAAKNSGYTAFHFLSPRSELPEHIVIPEIRLAFTSGFTSDSFPGKNCRRIRLDLLLSDFERTGIAKNIRTVKHLSAPLYEKGMSHLAKAKELHDRLELFYIPRMDFGGVTAMAERHGERLLQKWTKFEIGV